MTNQELARACYETKGCYKCKPEIKRECLKNECWKADNPKQRKIPSVYYGVLPEAPEN